MMKSVLASAALAVILAAPALAQPPSTATEGTVKVEGVSPEKVLGAIDTEKLIDEAPPAETTELPQPRTQVTVDTSVRETPTAVIETTTETITPVSDRPALDPENPIAPEVQALVESKPNYTTKDIAAAQLAAVLATPAAAPTTIVTTTTTTPKDGG